jgi:prophage DNA circulation protein
MFKSDAQEAVPIINAVMTQLLLHAPSQGRIGFALREAVNAFRVDAMALMMANDTAASLMNIFTLAEAFALPEMESVRLVAAAQNAVSVGATLIRDSLVRYALVAEGVIIANMTFVSRDEVEALQPIISAAYAPAEEAAADAMDAAMYQALIAMHAAITYFLTNTAQPLPMMLNFQFASPLPTVVAAYKLYADASRADDLRAQNQVVHPAFMLPYGRALSQ